MILLDNLIEEKVARCLNVHTFHIRRGIIAHLKTCYWMELKGVTIMP